METFKYKDVEFQYVDNKVRNTIVLNLYRENKLLNDFYGESIADCIEQAKKWLDIKMGGLEKTNSDKVVDEHGNYILVSDNNEVTLFLASESKTRKMGTINKVDSNFIVTRKKEVHLHRNTNSYGFNYRFLQENKSFSFILLKEFVDRKVITYRIPKNIVMNNGNFQLYSKQGFELQIFLTLEEIETYKIDEKEK